MIDFSTSSHAQRGPIPTGRAAARLERVARWLERGGDTGDRCKRRVHFAMETFGDNTNVCGTPACIAGAVIAFNYRTRNSIHQHPFDAANQLLGLHPWVAQELFYASGAVDIGYSLSQVKPEWAAKVVRHLLATGEVDWKKFAPGRE